MARNWSSAHFSAGTRRYHFGRKPVAAGNQYGLSYFYRSTAEQLLPTGNNPFRAGPRRTVNSPIKTIPSRHFILDFPSLASCSLYIKHSISYFALTLFPFLATASRYTAPFRSATLTRAHDNAVDCYQATIINYFYFLSFQQVPCQYHSVAIKPFLPVSSSKSFVFP